MRDSRPAVALFCATFLKPEMLHVYRHVTGLRTFCPIVLAQKTEGNWPVKTLEVISRSPWRFLSRGAEKRTGEPWQITKGEVRRFRAAMDRHACEVLHVFFGNIAIHLLPLLREAGRPVVVSFHGSDVAGSMASEPYRAAVKELFSIAAVVPCRSQQLAGAVGQLGCPAGKLRVMRTILPDIPVTPRPSASAGWRIVQAARLVPKKGLASAMRAFAEFLKSDEDATFTIAGEGPMEEELRSLASELKITDAVKFTGFLSQEELQDLFARSHIFLHPSETVGSDVEGVPNAMLEAMAGGLPVITTRHGGIPEVIRDGENGLLCEERRPDQILAALQKLTTDGELYLRLSECAESSVREQFSADRQIAAVEQIYREAIAA